MEVEASASQSTTFEVATEAELTKMVLNWPRPSWTRPLHPLKEMWALDYPVAPPLLRSRFVVLPERIEELFSQLAEKTYCPTKGPGYPIASPGICLSCGQVMCASSECCRRNNMGACHLHAAVCGCGVGAFLLAGRAEVYFVRGKRGALTPAPYVDAEGEPDPRLRRGRPLRLSQARYDELLRTIADHRVASFITAARLSGGEGEIM